MDIKIAHLPHGGNRVNHPDTIVVHAMGEYLKDKKTLHATDFLNYYGLSAHALVDSNGNIFRCREDNERAWHARGHNTNSLGIEFLVKGEYNYSEFVKAIEGQWVTEEQYNAGLWQIKTWAALYGINTIVRHSDLSPGRKVDPGNGFPWERLVRDIN